MTNVYCSIGKVPKKMRLGSMKECAEKKQIRLYGIKKIDSKLLELAKGSKKDANTRDNAIHNLSKFKGKLKNLEGKLSVTKKKEDKEEVTIQIEKIKKEIDKWSKKFKELDKLRDEKKKLKRSSSKYKKGSLKGSNKGSKKN